MSAKLNGDYDDALLDAIGNWKHRSLPREFYEDFVIPKETSGVILRSERFRQVDPEKTGRPDFEDEDLICRTNLSEAQLEEDEVPSDADADDES